jgi:integrase
LSAKSVRHIGTLLHTCLVDALRLGHPKVNPMADHRVILPKLPKREPPVLDTGRIVRMFNRARGTRMFAFVVLASASGCRRGELLALEWTDINFDAGLMMVSKSLEQTKQGLRIKSTKSENRAESASPMTAWMSCANTVLSRTGTGPYTGKATRITIWSSANRTAPTTAQTEWAPAWRNCCARRDYMACRCTA